MRINIKATGIELTEAISQYTEKKIASIEKYFNAAADAVAQVEVGKTSEHHKNGGNVFRAEVHIIGAGLDLYAVSEQADLYAAIDLVKDEIVKTMTHEKGKRDKLTRRAARTMKNVLKGLNFFKRKP